MSKNLSAKYYQENTKKTAKKKKKNSYNIVEKVTDISQKMKNKNLLSIEKTIIE